MRPAEVILVPPPWFEARVVPIGDAAHATTPHLASGAGMAIEDSVVLGELLRTGAPVAEVLGTFMERHYERCRTVVTTSIQLGDWQQQPGTPGGDPAALARATQTLLAQPI
jgi:2-polyprenyl-6-methoxyphenol hydroxylase-like FAD-dependent oxidoreductase